MSRLRAQVTLQGDAERTVARWARLDTPDHLLAGPGRGPDRPAQAGWLSEHAVAIVNDGGALTKEIDPARGELLGDLSLPFSHVWLVTASAGHF